MSPLNTRALLIEIANSLLLLEEDTLLFIPSRLDSLSIVTFLASVESKLSLELNLSNFDPHSHMNSIDSLESFLASQYPIKNNNA